jgi:hypothetical protein
VLEDRPFVSTAGYEFSRILGFWPLLWLLGFLAPTRTKWSMFAMGSLVAYLILQLVFQKRAPFVRTLLYALVPLALPVLTAQRRGVGRAIAAVLFIVVMLSVLSTTEFFERLMDRYRSDDPLLQSSRLLEAESLLSGLVWPEHLIGRGMGGYFVAPLDWSAGLVEVREDGLLGRTGVHIGILVPLLKGGAVFLVLIVSCYLSAFTPRPRIWYESRYNVAAIGIVPVYLASLTIEGGVGLGNILDVLLIGLAVGRLSRKERSAQAGGLPPVGISFRARRPLPVGRFGPRQR